MNEDINFWTYSDDIPDGVGFNQFSVTHILWLVIIIATAFIMAVIYKKSDNKIHAIILKMLGSILLFNEKIHSAYRYKGSEQTGNL